MRRLTYTPELYSNSAYLYIPVGTFINRQYEYVPIARCHKNIPEDSCFVYKTVEGYSWQKKYFLLVPGSPLSLKMDRHAGHWYYDWRGDRYPALAKDIPWPELELIELFS